MFNNPFDSFHDTVAEAKEEREQLNRLLMISTPRERLLVAVIALLIIVLAAWLVFGNISRNLVVDGVLVDPADAVITDDRSVQVLVWVESGSAPTIGTGMTAVVELVSADGEPDEFGGEIAAVSAVLLSDELTDLEITAPVSVRRVDIVLDESLDLPSLTSRGCRVVVNLGKQSPLDLLRMRRP